MYSMSHKLDGEVLVVVSSGIVENGDQAVEKANAVVDLALRLERKRMLLDQRELISKVDVHEIVNVAGQLEGRGLLSLGARAACLPNPAFRAVYRVYETAFNNRSFSYRLFDDYDQAMAWLGK